MGNTTNMTAELMEENMSKQLLTFVCGSKATPSLISAMKKLSAKNEAILKRGKNKSQYILPSATVRTFTESTDQ